MIYHIHNNLKPQQLIQGTGMHVHWSGRGLAT